MFCYVCTKCAKSILPSELTFKQEEGVLMPYHSYCAKLFYVCRWQLPR